MTSSSRASPGRSTPATFGRFSVDFVLPAWSSTCPSALLHAPPWNSSAIRCLPAALGHYLAKWRLSACTPQPSNIKELQGFLGLLNFYRRFIPKAAKLLAPLTEVLKGAPSATCKLQWSQPMLTAFLSAKLSLASAAELAYPSSAAELAVLADASSSHMGAALHQRSFNGGPWEPLGFLSRKLAKAQISYSAFDRELLAAFSAIRHFRFQLEGREFQLLTDHRPLTQALSRCSDAWSPRQQCQLSYIAEYTADIRYVLGLENVMADTLSCLAAIISSVGAVQQPQAASLCALPPGAVISSAGPVGSHRRLACELGALRPSSLPRGALQLHSRLCFQLSTATCLSSPPAWTWRRWQPAKLRVQRWRL